MLSWQCAESVYKSAVRLHTTCWQASILNSGGAQAEGLHSEEHADKTTHAFMLASPSASELRRVENEGPAGGSCWPLSDPP